MATKVVIHDHGTAHIGPLSLPMDPSVVIPATDEQAVAWAALIATYDPVDVTPGDNVLEIKQSAKVGKVPIFGSVTEEGIITVSLVTDPVA